MSVRGRVLSLEVDDVLAVVNARASEILKEGGPQSYHHFAAFVDSASLPDDDFSRAHYAGFSAAHARWLSAHRNNVLDLDTATLTCIAIKDIIEYEQGWTTFFKDIRNSEFTARSVGVINTHATLLRQAAQVLLERGLPADEGRFFDLLRSCERALNLGGAQLKILTDMQPIPGFDGNKCELPGLTYKYLTIKHNVLRITGRATKTNPAEVRSRCEYELREYGENNQALLGNSFICGQIWPSLPFVISYLRNPASPPQPIGLGELELPLTLSALANRVTDEHIRFIYKELIEWNNPDGTPLAFQLSTRRCCSGCGRFEDTERGERFSFCGSCRSEPFCGPECQRESWRWHKKVCVKRSV